MRFTGAKEIPGIPAVVNIREIHLVASTQVTSHYSIWMLIAAPSSS
jgi:hypothetical protein